jgi:hypothetical protein
MQIIVVLWFIYCLFFLLNELYFWILSIVWCLKKLRNKNIYTKTNHNTQVQTSHKGQLLTTEPFTWVHTQHKPLKQVGHRWQQMTHPLHTSPRLKSGKLKYRIQTKAHANPHTPWSTRSQGKTQVAISDTACVSQVLIAVKCAVDGLFVAILVRHASRVYVVCAPR